MYYYLIQYDDGIWNIYFQAGLFNLRMSLEILKDEPEGSFEQKIVAGSQESVAQLEEWVKTVCTSLW